MKHTNEKKRILLFGKNGQMACEFARLWGSSSKANHKAYGSNDIELIQAARPEVDFLKPETVREVVLAVKPDIVVNAAAYTAVDLAETEKEQAMRINADAVAAMCEGVKKTDSLLIHFSTDYVFDGSKQSPYNEDDPVNPINYYGLTKLHGEQAIAASQIDAYIFRVAWLYGEFGKNFYKTMIHLFQNREEVKVVNDQLGTPTNTAWLAGQVSRVLNSAQFWEKTGLYHLAPAGSCTWFQFAQEILENAKQKAAQDPGVMTIKCTKLTPITTAEFPTPAMRPKNSVLACSKFNSRFSIERAPW